ncbi:UNKNOWN [Stylonychia lemnae]|uniref:Uncharacterized protein n=1 Tax=Stylonychia lemnae TaxID=5949 RepID=A0A077ZMM3_STYLE|nr:UNKNOWN [Stylonychia lemnae]|eukprot:CDW71188.1 UNKNOWN [Stylonychia lemnae]
MRVLVLGASTQKVKVADKLIKTHDLSKILLSVGSKKLVTNAQALIIYYESQDDLKKMRKLLKIYLGVPIKFYIGNENPENFENYFNYEQVTELLAALQEQHKKIEESAEKIYNSLLDGKTDLTVEDMLQGLEENERDVIEEICVEYFAERKQDRDPKKVIVKKKKFLQWWSEGKIDKYEQIKFYIIDWVIQQLQKQGVDELHQKNYNSYVLKKKEIRILREHFESNFEFIIQPSAIKEESKDGKQPQLASQLFKAPAGGAVGGGKNMFLGKGLGLPAGQQPQPSPKEQKKMNFEEAKGKAKAKGETRQPVQKIGTLIDFKVTFFPSESDEKILYLKNLHMFEEDSWVSIGLKPKAKDLKSVIEDIEEMEYIKSLEEDYCPSIVVDGKKVRIGLESDKLDPFYDTYCEEGEQLERISQVLDDKSIEAVLEFQLQLTQKLDAILHSEDPIITEICKGLKIEGSLKFHNKQFRKVLEESTEIKWKDFSEKGEEEKKDDQPKDSQAESEQESESHEDKDSDDNDSDSDGYGEEESEEGYGNDSDNNDEDGDDEDDEESKSKFDLKSFFKYTLPLFMFKWKSKVEINPDINDIKAYCLKNQEESYLLGNFKKLVMSLNQTDLDEAAKQALQQKKKGTRRELLNYLSQEVGSEIEFAWRTSCFLLTGQVKTDEMGKVIKTLSNSKFF